MLTVDVYDFLAVYDVTVTRTSSDEKCRFELDCREKRKINFFKMKIQESCRDQKWINRKTHM